ncbi:MAG TPA: trehalose-phosphatase [Gemmatimonadaceae bacterium]|nr:trehalose-phosphatase [Gemmatimonadaceae bacterium]
MPDPGWAFFFDIDGTLADLAPTPSEVRLEHDLHQLIRDLYRSSGGALALISGRSIDSVDSIFGGPHFPVAGHHGLERRSAAGKISRHDATSEKLEIARARLSAIVVRHRGLTLEDKGLSLALHYRAAPALASFAHRTMRAVHSHMGPEYAILTGKRIIELKPSGKDKGEAVLEFMEEQPFRGRTPVFVGDDLTDEHGFAAVNALGGHSIKVGPGRTAARWRLRDVEAVQMWLERATNHGDTARVVSRRARVGGAR